MKQRLINLDTTIQALKPFLEQFLQEHNIDTNSNFSCINPEHEDSSPSMSCRQYPERAFCFGCNCAADIFAAAHYLEKKPLSGIRFIEENVLYLAKKYDITVELEDLTQEELYEYRTYEAYSLAAKLVQDPSFGDYSKIDKEIERRQWDKDKITNWGIGTVNYKEFKTRMIKAGFDVKFLNGVDLNRQNLFNENNLIFTVNDDKGRPVGFSARNLNYSKDNGEKKYNNTRVTGLQCNIFKKGERLYGFDVAKEMPSPLYLFEGQADVITARHHKLMNCCCSLGTALTDHHVNLLKKYGIFNIILVFDSDKAGELALQKALDTKLSSEKSFRVKLIHLPEGKDPDDLLRNEGIDTFARLKKWSAFEWRMSKFLEEHNDQTEDIAEEKRREIAEKMAKIIVTEKSHIQQEEMSKQVARMTGYELSTIMSEVKRLRSEKESNIQDKKRAAAEALLFEIRNNPDEIESALVQAQHTINDINKTIQTEETSNSTLRMLLSQKETDDNRSGEFAGFYLNPIGLGGIGARLNDDWKTDSLIFIGGSEQSGKTMISAQLCYEITNDERNNAICIYHSIDDPIRRITYRLVCNATGGTKLHMNHISSPKYWLNQPGHEFIMPLKEEGYKHIFKLAEQERIVLKDAQDGSSFTYIESVAQFYRAKYPSKKIVLFIDNFHKLPDMADISGHERIKRLSNRLKNSAVNNKMTIIATVEYRKLLPGARPDNDSLADSRALKYDADVLIHLFNDLHHKDEDTAIAIHQDENGIILPRIECKFGKNKISGFEGREFLDMFPYAGQYRAVDSERAKREITERVEFLRENKI